MDTSFGSYDFGLSAEQEARAAALHAGALIVDMLWQGSISYHTYPDELSKRVREAYERDGNAAAAWASAFNTLRAEILAGNVPAHRDVWEASGVTAGCFETSIDLEGGLASFAAHIDMFEACDEWLVRAVRAEDFRRAKREGKRAAWLNCQMGVLVPAQQYRAAHRHGLRMFQLAYNTMNGIAAGCTERSDAGVSRAGAAVIAQLNDLGVIVDTSHCSRQTTLDACQLSSAPVIASHTACGAIYDCARAKSDEEIDALARTGGIVGVCAVPFFLSPDDVVTVETMLDHLDHMVRVAGPENVGIGCDWPMQAPKWVMGELLPQYAPDIGFRPGDIGDTASNVVGFDDYRDFPNLTRGLVARGYTDEQILGFLGENFLRVFEAVCG